jgi:hypothetical protein
LKQRLKPYLVGIAVSALRPIAVMPARWLHAQKQTSYMVNIVF